MREICTYGSVVGPTRQRVGLPDLYQHSSVGAVYDRPRSCNCDLLSGHRPPTEDRWAQFSVTSTSPGKLFDSFSSVRAEIIAASVHFARSFLNGQLIRRHGGLPLESRKAGMRISPYQKFTRALIVKVREPAADVIRPKLVE